MPYICLRRSDIPDATLQVLDLKPNTSQRNLIYDGPGQTKYVNRVQNDTVKTKGSGPITTAAEYKGLAAYLIDHIEAGGLAAGTAALTATQANTIAAALIARMDTGASMALSDINTVIAATVSDSELTDAGGSASTGSVADVLKILAGGEYVLPVGSTVDSDGSTFVVAQAGSFTTGQFRHTYATGALALSEGAGALSKFVASTFSYGGTSGAALVVYNDDGSVY